MSKTPLGNGLLTALLVSPALLAQGPTLLKDINTAPVSGTYMEGLPSWSAEFAQQGPTLYFSGDTVDQGLELWRSDLTAAGTTIVRDILPGNNSAASTTIGNPANLITAGGKVYFTYWTLATGRELWVYDPTSAASPTNPRLVKDITPGSAPQNNGDAPSNFFTYLGTLYFLADDGANGRELWATDGTTAGTAIAYESVPGPGTLFLTGFGLVNPEFHEWNGAVYFTQNGALHRYVGTPASHTVTQVDAASLVHGSIEYLTGVGSNLFFRADSAGVGGFGATDLELYKTNGTTITLVKDIIPGTTAGSNPQSFHAFGNVLMFSAGNQQYSWGGGGANAELWKSDGTTGGTVMVAEINPNVDTGGIGIGSNPMGFLTVGSNVYFAADNMAASWGGPANRELWKTDGTMAGTSMVADINTTTVDESSNPDYLTQLNGTTFLFTANDGNFGTELWKSDGTTLGTVLVKDIYVGGVWDGSSPAGLHQLAPGLVAFAANDGIHASELWKTDGTTAGTVLVKDIKQPLAGQTQGGNANGMVDSLKGFSVFAANNGTSGTEPWRTDGTTLGTVPLKDINPSGDSYPSSFVASGQYVYFSANDGTNGSELWRTDGVPETLTNIHTTLVADINVGSNGSYPGNITSFTGGRVLFSADDGVSGSELWISDGTSLGTTSLTNINIAGGSNPSNITEWNGKAYFLANDLNYLTNVWKTDGTPAGTTQVTAFGAGYISNWNNPFVKFGGKLWFAADDGIVGTELCSIDAAGTVTFLDLNAAGGSNPGNLTVWNGALYFLADIGTGLGFELYKTDGTLSGTVLVKDINPLPFGNAAYPTQGIMHALDAGLVLFADDGVHGTELWKSDGTAAGTVLLKDIVVGPDSSEPSFGQQIGSRRAYFSAAGRPSDDVEPWVTDGTAAGTYQIGDVNPGVARSNPSNWHLLNGKLLFEASDPLHGSELRVYSPGATMKAVGRSSGSSTYGYPTLRSTDPAIGKVMTVSGDGGKAGDVAYLFIGLPAGGETVFPYAGTGITYHIYGVNSYPLFPTAFPLSGTGTYSLPIPIPYLTGIVGFPLSLQAWVVPATPIGQLTLTNAAFGYFGL